MSSGTWTIPPPNSDPGNQKRRWQSLSPGENTQPLWDMLEERKIIKQAGKDILCWGYTPSGNFNIKEATSLQENYNALPKKQKWNKI